MNLYDSCFLIYSKSIAYLELHHLFYHLNAIYLSIYLSIYLHTHINLLISRYFNINIYDLCINAHSLFSFYFLSFYYCFSPIPTPLNFSSFLQPTASFVIYCLFLCFLPAYLPLLFLSHSLYISSLSFSYSLHFGLIFTCLFLFTLTFSPLSLFHTDINLLSLSPLSLILISLCSHFFLSLSYSFLFTLTFSPLSLSHTGINFALTFSSLYCHFYPTFSPLFLFFFINIAFFLLPISPLFSLHPSCLFLLFSFVCFFNVCLPLFYFLSLFSFVFFASYFSFISTFFLNVSISLFLLLFSFLFQQFFFILSFVFSLLNIHFSFHVFIFPPLSLALPPFFFLPSFLSIVFLYFISTFPIGFQYNHICQQ
ncbi:unnamed protein product [Acanthosepion pharaonis]|uniref:Uncharacterized protein n=1 Tax=Acanthosepion pharaonis TaxID=158019 RepID=A0A812E3W4_ACAPH|nr:unnamed protein product [Sepia pharaonis]